MRCRKVRSCLSAYCRDELPDGQRMAIGKHLESCPDCRKELAVCRDFAGLMKELPPYRVSDDFNARLLDRIAEERLRPQKTKAFLPRRIPLFGRSRLIPAVAAACLILAFVFIGGLDRMFNPDQTDMYTAENNGTSDEWFDRYKDVQPVEKHDMIQHAGANWEFKKQVARVNRIKQLMNQVSGQNNFASGQNQQVLGYYSLPAGSVFFRKPFDAMPSTVSSMMNTAYPAAEVQ